MSAQMTNQWLGPAVIAALASKLPNKLGRTGVMKLVYFLQTVQGVKLGYSFRLYTYGPYDTQVLEDIGRAEAAGAVKSTEFKWSRGSGYVLSVAQAADALLRRAASDLAKIEESLEWVTKEFGDRSASDLEVASTLVYVDRSFLSSGENVSLTELVDHVHNIKPHHPVERIRAEATHLVAKNILKSISSTPAVTIQG